VRVWLNDVYYRETSIISITDATVHRTAGVGYQPAARNWPCKGGAVTLLEQADGSRAFFLAHSARNSQLTIAVHDAENGKTAAPAALDATTMRSLAVFAVGAGCVAALVGCMVLVGGWAFDMDALKSVLPGMSTMKPNTAAGIVMLGTGLALAAYGRSSHIVGEVAAAVALSLGLITLAEYAIPWNAGIDQLLFKDSAATFPGRPAVATALMISLLGAALLCVHRPALHMLKTFAGLSTTLIAWGSLSAYVFGGQALQEVPLFTSLSLHTAVVMLLLGVGVLAAEPVSWPVRLALAQGTGGVICRGLLPPAILAPPFLGWFLTRRGVSDFLPSQIDWVLYSAIFSLGSAGLIMLLAHRIALIEAERTVATEQSLHDALTGLANRRAFESFLLENFNLSERHQHALSLMLIDIDCFKAYNDAYGHPAGDELLKNLGALLSSVERETDLLVRIGGDEFAVVMPETDIAGAHVLAERARAKVERSSLFRRRMTVSVGIATMTDRTASTSMLLQDCDAALYRAKKAGRNQVSGGTELADVRSG
jgi:diguanylate cyclase (GGDEF)-like protein